MNPILDVLVPQLARPHGILGHVVAAMLDHGNRSINLHVVGALDLKPRDRVLELGFGGGVGLATVLAHEPTVELAGVDISAPMVARCTKRFGKQVALREGSVDALPFPDGAFDKAFGVNVTYFWPDMSRGLAEVRRVLAPGGTVIFGVRPPEMLRHLHFDRAGHRVWTPDQYVQALCDGGFTQPRAQRMPDRSGAYVISALRG